MELGEAFLADPVSFLEALALEEDAAQDLILSLVAYDRGRDPAFLEILDGLLGDGSSLSEEGQILAANLRETVSPSEPTPTAEDTAPAAEDAQTLPTERAVSPAEETGNPAFLATGWILIALVTGLGAFLALRKKAYRTASLILIVGIALMWLLANLASGK